jgi:hypothetical protein
MFFVALAKERPYLSAGGQIRVMNLMKIRVTQMMEQLQCKILAAKPQIKIHVNAYGVQLNLNVKSHGIYLYLCQVNLIAYINVL